MLYLNLPIVFSLLIYGLNKLTINNYETYEIIGLLYSLGILLATNAINVGHELGHRKNVFEFNPKYNTCVCSGHLVVNIYDKDCTS